MPHTTSEPAMLEEVTKFPQDAYTHMHAAIEHGYTSVVDVILKYRAPGVDVEAYLQYTSCPNMVRVILRHVTRFREYARREPCPIVSRVWKDGSDAERIIRMLDAYIAEGFDFMGSGYWKNMCLLLPTSGATAHVLTHSKQMLYPIPTVLVRHSPILQELADRMAMVPPLCVVPNSSKE